MQWDADTQKATVLEVGHIDNKKQGRVKWSHGANLWNIYCNLSELFKKYPEINKVVREQGFSRFNKATQALFRVVGIADMIVEYELHDVITEYSVSTVKKEIAGNGKADKSEVADALSQYLIEEIEFAVDDESDAVAIGVTHFLQSK